MQSGFPRSPRSAAHGAIDARFAQALVGKLLDVGIDGTCGFEPADAIAANALRENRSAEAATFAVIAAHRRMIAAGGFVTGLGGFITMPAALPANLVEFYAITTRMVGAVAAIRGHDLADPAVRTAILLTLVDADPEMILRRAGLMSGDHAAKLSAGMLPAPARMMVNKAIGFQLVRQFGERLLARLGRGVPVAGGVIGAGLDIYLFGRIADGALREFPQR